METYISIVYLDLLGNKAIYEHLQGNPYQPKFKIENFNHQSARQKALVMLARKKLTFMERIMDGFVPDPEIPFLEAVMDHTRETWNDKIFLHPKSDGKIEYYYLSDVREGLNKITFS
jgi:hypothetical protein